MTSKQGYLCHSRGKFEIRGKSSNLTNGLKETLIYEGMSSRIPEIMTLGGCCWGVGELDPRIERKKNYYSEEKGGRW
jgi:hypothetical protein